MPGPGGGAGLPEERDLARRLHDPQLLEGLLELACPHSPRAHRPSSEAGRPRVGVDGRLAPSPLAEDGRQLLAVAHLPHAEGLPRLRQARDAAHPDRVRLGEPRHEQRLGAPGGVEEQRVARLLHAGQVEEVRSLPVSEVHVAVAEEAALLAVRPGEVAVGEGLAVGPEQGRHG